MAADDLFPQPLPSSDDCWEPSIALSGHLAKLVDWEGYMRGGCNQSLMYVASCAVGCCYIDRGDNGCLFLFLFLFLAGVQTIR